MTKPPVVPHPSRHRQAVRALAPWLDLRWQEGGRHGAPVPDTPHTLIHLCASDPLGACVREVLTDGRTLFGLRFDTPTFAPIEGMSTLADLQRYAVARHLDALCTAKPREARLMLSMLVCSDAGAVARTLSANTRAPVGVTTDPVTLLWRLLAPHPVTAD